MAVYSTWIPSLKFLLISIGVVSIAMIMKLSVPLVVQFVCYEIPVFWSCFMSLLRPPYLYFVVNAIIITIAASSRFHHKLDETERGKTEPLIPPKPPQSDGIVAYEVMSKPEFGRVELPAVYESDTRLSEVVKTVVVDGAVAEDGDEEEFVISRSSWTPPQRTKSLESLPEIVFPTPEKPLVSTRLVGRKPSNSSPEGGRALRVAKPKQYETMENTWKTITEGRQMPLTRHLKRRDTWENHCREINSTIPVNQSPPAVKKSETFRLRDRTNYDPPSSPAKFSPGSAKIRKEPSLSQDELNRRVEAFIRKFNDEMRLQRQESFNHYMEMINRGGH